MKRLDRSEETGEMNATPAQAFRAPVEFNSVAIGNNYYFLAFGDSR
jgi:hypothetical protein